jgi:dTDP-4-amino-4,6-dideoxygalactose transaminase
MSGEPVPIVRPALPELDELMPAFRDILESGQVTTGAWTRRLEHQAARRLEVDHVVATGSGTSALTLALRGLDLSAGVEDTPGEVITSAFSWTATAHAISWNGLTPVFADIDPDTLTLDPEATRDAITERTVGILPVNVFGLAPDVAAFDTLARERDLTMVYDSAQGLGSRIDGRPVGGHGHAECFSMSPTKVVTGIECGLVSTRDGELATRLRSLRDCGKDPAGSGDVLEVGMSARLSELNAAVATLNLERLDALVERRRELIAGYRERLAGLPGLRFQHLPNGCESSGNYFVVRLGAEAPLERDELQRELAAQGIQSKRYFWPALHQQRAYAHRRSAHEGRLPHSEEAARTALALPLFHSLAPQAQERVCAAVRRAFGAPD